MTSNAITLAFSMVRYYSALAENAEALPPDEAAQLQLSLDKLEKWLNAVLQQFGKPKEEQ